MHGDKERAGSAARHGASGLERCFSVWIGPRLSAMAAACLNSFVEMGHQVDLYVYDEPAGVPSGVTVKDAAAHVPRDRIIRHEKGSYALFSDLFRYELLAREAGLWIDTDVLCVRPIQREGEYVFGFESSERINGAVLRLPATSPILSDLRSIFEPGWIPPWHHGLKRAAHALRYRIGSGYGVSKMSWGSAGPRALTFFARRHGIAGFARPIEEFYPLPPSDALRVTRPDLDLSRIVTDRTLCIHLWADKLSGLQQADIHPRSFLAAVANGSWRDRVFAG
jgi:hypothetical protein